MAREDSHGVPWSSYRLASQARLAGARSDRNSAVDDLASQLLGIGSTGQVLALPLAGAASDRLGRGRVYMWGAAGLAAFCIPFWMLLETRNFWPITIAMLIGLGLLHSLMYGVQPAFFAETFSTEVR
ncbi:MFS transporter [Mycobacterium sp. C31M]